MSEDNHPVFPTDDMAIAALIKHWRAQTNRHAQRQLSPVRARSRWHHLPLRERARQLTLRLIPIYWHPRSLFLPVPPIVIVSAWQTLASQIADGSPNSTNFRGSTSRT